MALKFGEAIVKYEKQFLDLIDYNEKRKESTRIKLYGDSDNGAAKDFCLFLEKINEAINDSVTNMTKAYNTKEKSIDELYKKLSTEELNSTNETLQKDLDNFNEKVSSYNQLKAEEEEKNKEIEEIESSDDYNSTGFTSNAILKRQTAINKVSELEQELTAINNKEGSAYNEAKAAQDTYNNDLSTATTKFNEFNANYKTYQKSVKEITNMFLDESYNIKEASQTALLENTTIYNGILNYLQNVNDKKFSNKFGTLSIEDDGKLYFTVKNTDKEKETLYDECDLDGYKLAYQYKYSISGDYTSAVSNFNSYNNSSTNLANSPEADLAIKRYYFCIKRYHDEVIRLNKSIEIVSKNLYDSDSIGGKISDLFTKLNKAKNDYEDENEFKDKLKEKTVISAMNAFGKTGNDLYNDYIKKVGNSDHKDEEEIANATNDFYIDLLYHKDGNFFSSDKDEINKKNVTVDNNIFYKACSSNTYIEDSGTYYDTVLPSKFILNFDGFKNNDKYVKAETEEISTDFGNIKVASTTKYFLEQSDKKDDLSKSDISNYYIASKIEEINEDNLDYLGDFKDPISKYFEFKKQELSIN